MTRPVHLRFESHLNAPARDVWDVAMRLAGINAESMPVFRMTHPAHIRAMTDAPFEAGKKLFHSRVLALGFIPFDWTDLTLTQYADGQYFVEQSPMGSMHKWQHRRSVIADGAGCTIIDELDFTPKLPAPLARPFIALAFWNRHRNLRRRWGQRVQIA